MVLVCFVGILVFGIGGLGGVYCDGYNMMDIFVDFIEFGCIRVVVVSFGCKGFFDIFRMFEYFEIQGCLILIFVDGWIGNIDFFGFWVCDSGFKSFFVV